MTDSAEREYDFRLIGRDNRCDDGSGRKRWPYVTDTTAMIYQDLCHINAYGDVDIDDSLEACFSARLSITNLTDSLLTFSCNVLGILIAPYSDITEWKNGFSETTHVIVTLEPHETRNVRTNHELAYIGDSPNNTTRGVELRLKISDEKIFVTKTTQVYP